MNFQAPATPVSEGIIDLHHDLMAILIVVFSIVTTALIYFISYFHYPRAYKIYNITHDDY